MLLSGAGPQASPFNGMGPLLAPNPWQQTPGDLTPGQLARQQGANLYAPTSAPAAAAATPPPTPLPSPIHTMGGGGGGGFSGGGGIAQPAAAAAAPPVPAVPRPSLQDYISNNFLYNSTKAQGDNALSDYNAGTLKGEQNVQGDQALKLNNLQTSLNDAGTQSADNLAAHGLLRSGFNFQNQDKINQQGDIQKNNIANMLTDFLGQRAQGQQQQVNANQSALNNAINNITTQYNSGQTLA